MQQLERIRAELSDAVSGAPSARAAADRLCEVCVELLEIDGASISLIHKGATQGTFGSSGERSRRLDELQFTFGEGPCLDSVAQDAPVFAANLDASDMTRWPALTGAMLQHGINAVFALPVSVARRPIGALDLFRDRPGPLTDDDLTCGLWAAELAALPLLDLMASVASRESEVTEGAGWDQLASLERVEVYQATGMIMAALDVDPAEALVRLRAYAFSHSLSASEVAWAVVQRRLLPDESDWRRLPGRQSGTRP